MELPLPAHKLVSAQEMHSVIARILQLRRSHAYQSQYDVTVCVRSVDAAEDVIEGIPVEGTAREYGLAVDAALGDLRENYFDSDGEYTSKGLVGDIGGDVYQLLQAQESPDIIDVSRDEAHACLLQEMRQIAKIFPRPFEGALEATMKTEVNGAGGVEYFITMSFEQLPDGAIVMSGGLYTDDAYQYPVLQERLALEEDNND